jgi:hypothetical protein
MKKYAYLTRVYVDVKDVVEACILVYEIPSSNGHTFLYEKLNTHQGNLIYCMLGSYFSVWNALIQWPQVFLHIMKQLPRR